MSSLRSICRPHTHTIFSSFICCSSSSSSSRDRFRFLRLRCSFGNPDCGALSSRQFSSPSAASSSSSSCGFSSSNFLKSVSAFRSGSRRTFVRASKWTQEKSPYETLGLNILGNFSSVYAFHFTHRLKELERDADEETIKVAYRRLAKYYHPDVYDGRGTLEEGETAEARFIKIQAAYELLIDEEKRRQYDTAHLVNPMKASQSWMEWLMKKRKAFDQRGDLAIAAWAEQQQLEMNLRARRLSRSKVDPDEERRILAKEKKASVEYFNTTLKRHTLVLKKRDLMRKKAEEQKKKVIGELLAAEGLELAPDDDDTV
ncbi:hypothetical protein Scep_001707 [Stephania cephalantha]|uniref:J domain-containing protein n=1 Tax=Stephania cephalantha TaxID=152367 RepID=A0AAP0L8X0_9MAGN